MCLHVHVATHLLKLSAVIYLSGNQLTLKVQARIFKVQSLYIFFLSRAVYVKRPGLQIHAIVHHQIEYLYKMRAK